MSVVEARLMAQILDRMRSESGSVTLHFKDGELMQVEYRTIEKVRPEPIKAA